MADRRRVPALAGAFLAGSVLLAGCGTAPPVSGVTGTDNHGYTGGYLADPYPLSTVALPGTGPGEFRLEGATGPLTVLFFGYTHCPDECIVMMSTISQALARLEAAQRDQVRVVFVTTDPDRDDAAVLREFLDRFGDGYRGLTGPIERIRAFAEPLHVFIGARSSDGTGYEVDHSTYAYGITPAGARVIWSLGISPSAMAGDIGALLQG